MDVTPSHPELPIRQWMPPFDFRSDLLNAAQCQELIDAAHQEGLEPAVRLRGDGSEVVDRKFLLSDFVLLSGDHPTYLALRQHFHDQIESLNRRFDLALYTDPELCIPHIKVCRYQGAEAVEDQGFISWHSDSGPTEFSSQRKLSASILLNDPSEYEGGDLAIFSTISLYPFQENAARAGDGVLFASHMQHVVKRLQRGTRYVCIVWFHGPRMR